MPKTQTKRWRDRVLKQTGGGAEELPSAQRITSAWQSRRRSRTPRTRPADREVGEAAVSPPGSGPSDAPEQGGPRGHRARLPPTPQPAQLAAGPPLALPTS